MERQTVGSNATAEQAFDDNFESPIEDQEIREEPVYEDGFRVWAGKRWKYNYRFDGWDSEREYIRNPDKTHYDKDRRNRDAIMSVHEEVCRSVDNTFDLAGKMQKSKYDKASPKGKEKDIPPHGNKQTNKTNDNKKRDKAPKTCNRFVKTGKCKFGAKCKFEHPVDKSAKEKEEKEAAEKAATENSENGVSSRQATHTTEAELPVPEGECSYYFRHGKCKFGAKCKFTHNGSPADQMPTWTWSASMPSFKTYLPLEELERQPWYDPLGARANYQPQLVRKSHPLAATARSLAELKVLTCVQSDATAQSEMDNITATASLFNVMEGKDAEGNNLDVDETREVFREVDDRKWLLVDLYGNDRTKSACAYNEEHLPMVEVLVCGEEHDGQDKMRRRNRLGLERALAEIDLTQYHGASVLLTDVYAVDSKEIFDRLYQLRINTLYTVRHQFNGSSGVLFDGEAEWKVEDGKILYHQHELGSTWYVSHTLEQENSWHEGNIVVDEKTCYSPFIINTVADYTITKWVLTERGVLKEFRTVDAMESYAEISDELHDLAFVDKYGRTQKVTVFKDIYFDGLSRTCLTSSTNYMVSTLRHTLRTAVMSPKYMKIYKILGKERGYELFANTLRAIVDSNQYQLRAVDHWLSDFLTTHASWLTGVCWVLKNFFGIEMTPEILVAKTFLVLKENAIKIHTHAMIAVDVFFSKIEEIFGVKPSVEPMFDMRDSFYVGNRGFDVYNADVVAEACKSDELKITGPAAVKGVLRGAKNESTLSTEEWNGLHNVALLVNQKATQADYFTYAHFSGFRTSPNNFSAMLNKAWPNKENQPKYRFECTDSSSECCNRHPHDPERMYYNIDLDADDFGQPQCCDEGRRLYSMYRNFRKSFQVPNLEVTPVTTEDYINRPDEKFKKMRREKAAQMSAQVTRTIEECSRIDIMMKKDEINRPDVSPENELMTKVRAIFNLKPEAQYLMSAYSDIYPLFKDAIGKTEFNTTSKSGKPWNIRAYMCSSDKRRELSFKRHQFDLEEDGTIYVLDAGDDLNIWIRDHNGVVRLWTLDAKSCDISMGLHQHAMFFDLLSSLGMEPLVVLLNTFAFGARAKMKFGNDFDRFSVYLCHMIQTFSGELFTSFKNTLIIISLIIGCLLEFLPTHEIDDNIWENFVDFVGHHTGITLEGEQFTGDNIDQCDFLKGWWVPHKGTYEFLPLPSRLLSWGKTRTNFVHTTPGKNNMPRSVRYAMHATARCNSAVPRNYPLLGSYLRLADRVSIYWPDSTNFSKFDSVYREPGDEPMFGGEEDVEVNVDTVLDMIKMRYGEEAVGVMEDVQAFCDEITFDEFEGFTVMGGFPGLSVFRDRDYGTPKIVNVQQQFVSDSSGDSSSDTSDDSDEGDHLWEGGL
jgi:DNA-binding protein H-NS